MKPTSEQVDCIEKFQTGKNLRISAFAGTGKSTVLKMIGESTRKSGTYICFNKANADEARRKFPRNVNCATTHSLAYRALIREYGPDRMTANVNGGILVDKMRLQGMAITSDFHIMPRGWGYLITQTLRRFQMGDLDQIEDWHVPLDGRLDLLDDKTKDAVRQRVAQDARNAWERMRDPRGDLPIGFDGFLKLWCLRRPQLDGDFILLDEGQDTNGVVMDLMRRQRAQLAVVGDANQQLYEWRGAQNAMTELPAELEARLSTSFRFGQEIADHASRILALLGERVPLKGNSALSSRIGETDKPDTILCRTNARLIEEVFAYTSRGIYPHIVGGVSEVMSYVDGAERLMKNQPVDRPADFFGFSNWSEVQFEAQRPEGQDLKRWVNLVDDYGVDALRRALNSLPRQEAGAPVILCTGHKSKGREWPAVRISDDFLLGIRVKDDATDKSLIEPTEAMHPELRLFYVAATRGQAEVDIHPEMASRIAKLEVGAARGKGRAAPAVKAA